MVNILKKTEFDFYRFQTSAKTNEGIMETFKFLTQKILERQIKDNLKENSITQLEKEIRPKKFQGKVVVIKKVQNPPPSCCEI